MRLLLSENDVDSIRVAVVSVDSTGYESARRKHLDETMWRQDHAR